MPSTWISTATWTIIRDELLWPSRLPKVPLVNTHQHPAGQAVMFGSLGGHVTIELQEGKQLWADFIIIMIYYYDPSQSKQSAERQ